MTTRKITRGQIFTKNIPDPLKVLKQWVCWRLDSDKNGKSTKVLYRPDGSRRKASHSDPGTWGTFRQALACFVGDDWYTGVGVTFASGLAGVDLDGFPRRRELPSWAARHVQRLNSYTEWSPSGQGLHVLVWGELPPGRRRTGPKDPHGVEMYDRKRFFTVTGDRLAGYDTIEERTAELAAMHAELFGKQEEQKAAQDTCRSSVSTVKLSDDKILELAQGARNGAKFARLWAGNAGDYSRPDGTPDHNAADQALCSLLAFYTRDAAQIDRLFRRSGLKRPKWDQRHSADGRTYGAMTIDAALSFAKEGYTPPGRSGENARSHKKRGRPHKAKLLTKDYVSLFQEWGYSARLNLCNDDVEVNGEPLSDVVEAQIRSQVRDYGTIYNVSVNMQHSDEALVAMAARKAFHPVKEYLEALQWDGQDHIAAVAAHITDREGLFPRWYRHWQVGAVAKVYGGFQNPMLVLDGPQDIGKSHFAAWLGSGLPSMFNASAISPESKDHKLRLIQTFVWEVEELGATTRRADVEALKAFISLRVVRERKVYGRRDILKPALTSFIGTLNDDAGFLLDRTGNRRFLVCTLIQVDWDYATSVDVNQVWAQALHLYRSGDGWRLREADKRRRDEVNEGYIVDDAIEPYLDKLYRHTGDRKDYVTLLQILDHLAVYNFPRNRATAMAISSVMRQMGAEKDRRRIDGERTRIFRRMRPRSQPSTGSDESTVWGPGRA